MVRTKLDIHAALARLADTERQPSLPALQRLSDLSREDFLQFQSTWGSLPPARRRWVVRHLVEMAEEHVELFFHPLLRWLLGDADPEVRVQAIEGLWEDEEAALIGPLARVLREDPDESVRAAAATALGRFILLGELEEIEVAIAVVAENALMAAIHTPTESIEVRRRAIEAISFSSEAGIRDMIRNAYHDEDDRMRASAVFAMGRSADRRWRGIVLAELDSSEPAMRFEAARACGELDLKDALPILATLAQEGDSDVQQAALWSLGRIGGPEARRILVRYANSANEPIRTAATAAIEELTFAEDALSFHVDDLDEDDEDDNLDVWDCADDEAEEE